MAKKESNPSVGPDVRQQLTQLAGAITAVEATGCAGAGGYVEYAHQRGYQHVEVYDWTSSAGDWVFLISKDGQEWQLLFQTNNYPRPGFSWSISGETYYGTAEEVADMIASTNQ